MNDEGAFERRKEVIEMSVYVKFETPKEISDKAYSLAEMARDGGKIKKGTAAILSLLHLKLKQQAIIPLCLPRAI